jgi:hypothetical protein
MRTAARPDCRAAALRGRANASRRPARARARPRTLQQQREQRGEEGRPRAHRLAEADRNEAERHVAEHDGDAEDRGEQANLPQLPPRTQRLDWERPHHRQHVGQRAARHHVAQREEHGLPAGRGVGRRARGGGVRPSGAMRRHAPPCAAMRAAAAPCGPLRRRAGRCGGGHGTAVAAGARHGRVGARRGAARHRRAALPRPSRAAAAHLNPVFDSRYLLSSSTPTLEAYLWRAGAEWGGAVRPGGEARRPGR